MYKQDKSRNQLNQVFPSVLVVMPIRNEAQYIERSIKAVNKQDYPWSNYKVVVVDGNSTDDTREIVKRIQKKHLNINLISNPREIVPVGLNIALRTFDYDIVIRVDGHCEIAADYVSQCVRVLQEKDVDGVGGPIKTIGETKASQGIAIAMSSFFGVGGSAFRTIGDKELLVDTIAFAAYPKKTILNNGLFDEELVRNQDDEYNYRIRKNGGKLLLSPKIQSVYYSRSTVRGVWRQYFEYGYWKVRVLQKHPFQMKMRQFVPFVFVSTLIGSLLLMPFVSYSLILLILILIVYLSVNIIASVMESRKNDWNYLFLLPVVFIALHFSYGFGFMIGLVKFFLLSGRRGLIDLRDSK